MTTLAAREAAPIGVFDSGVGGLTVARRILEYLPGERIVYVADQAHVPYGGRDLAEVRRFACGISAALVEAGCKAIVMACNISSAVALDAVRAEFSGLPVLGVIAPGAQAAAAHSVARRIGVLATTGTVKSGAYTRRLHALDQDFQVTEVACPAFVPLVEAGEENTDAAVLAAQEYLAPLRYADVDTIILGCTHYPFLLPVLQGVWNSPCYIDPAEHTALELKRLLCLADLTALPASGAEPRHLLTTTGEVTSFREHLIRFLPDAAHSARIAAIPWQNDCLRFASQTGR